MELLCECWESGKILFAVVSNMLLFILVECTWHLKKGVSEIWGGVLAYCSCDKQVIGGRDLKWGKCSTEGNG